MYIIKISEDKTMNIAPISNCDKTTFGYFAKPPIEVTDEIHKRLLEAKPDERDEFVRRAQEIVDENRNVPEEIIQGIETMNNRPSYYAKIGESHFVEPRPDDPPLKRIISVMETAGAKARDIANLKENTKAYDGIWA